MISIEYQIIAYEGLQRLVSSIFFCGRREPLYLASHACTSNAKKRSNNGINKLQWVSNDLSLDRLSSVDINLAKLEI